MEGTSTRVSPGTPNWAESRNFKFQIFEQDESIGSEPVPFGQSHFELVESDSTIAQHSPFESTSLWILSVDNLVFVSKILVKSNS